MSNLAKFLVQRIARQSHKLRIRYYQYLSDCRRVEGVPVFVQPALMLGQGEMRFGKNVLLGYFPSPHYYRGYIHLEARSGTALIEIGENTFLNNNSVILCDETKVSIGADCLIGPNFLVMDSDFHNLNPMLRRTGKPISNPVTLGRNIFVGANVTIVRGTNIGADSVVGAGSVVSGVFPPRVVIAGNPARIVKHFDT